MDFMDSISDLEDSIEPLTEAALKESFYFVNDVLFMVEAAAGET